MEAKDLRIGNWVERFVKNEGFYEIKVESDIIRSVEYHNDYGYDDDEIYYNPIPLTEEWLLKFGFEKVVFNSDVEGHGVEYRKSILHQNDYIIVFEDMSVGTQTFKDFAHVVYPLKQHVHQLQNLYFALTGEELVLTKWRKRDEPTTSSETT
jgi:hypothetical protein